MVRALVAFALVPFMLLFSGVMIALGEEVVENADNGSDIGPVQSVPVDTVPSDSTSEEVGPVDGAGASDGSTAAPTTLYDSSGDVFLTSEVQPLDVTGSPYSSVTGGTYDELAADVVAKLAQPFDDYLFYRTGNYSYVLVVGDISLDGTTFSGTSCDVVRFTRTSSDYGYRIGFSVEDLEVNVGDYIVRSNLGGYPQLDIGPARVELLLTACCALWLVHFVCKPVFAFVSRDRSR